MMRLLRILWVALRFRLYRFWPGLARGVDPERAERLRRALETLGPIFVKFGQVLSTRRDLLPLDIADELAQLQDRVPPFPAAQARADDRARASAQPIDEVFADFDAEAGGQRLDRAGALRDAARRHARWRSRCCARACARSSTHDLALLRPLAALGRAAVGRRQAPASRARWWPSSTSYLHDELDLVREAANAAQLRRNFDGLDAAAGARDATGTAARRSVMVMERMHGVPISQIERLRAAGRRHPSKLARDGVDDLLHPGVPRRLLPCRHAPGQHPGQPGPATFGRYIALDFGIIGTLTEVDKDYLAQNFLAFFRRDYKRVAEAARRARLGAGGHPRRRARGARSAPSASRSSTGR